MAGVLAAIAFVTYVFVYTPLKRRTTASLLVGAVPGAIPPLIGWSAATGIIDVPGLLLFATLFLWQVPHFLAIALFRRREFARAGLVVQPNEAGGDRAARLNIVQYTAALVAVSLMFNPFRVAHGMYFAVAAGSGRDLPGSRSQRPAPRLLPAMGPRRVPRFNRLSGRAAVGARHRPRAFRLTRRGETACRAPLDT
ncbi:MAG TPA: UbiA family prenyltransferase [Myxococcales bacterium]